MTPDQIHQLRQLLNRAQDYAKDSNIERLNSIDENQTYKWIMRDMFQAVSEALALLPCETCNGTKWLDWQHPKIVKRLAEETGTIPEQYPCPDCQQHSP